MDSWFIYNLKWVLFLFYHQKAEQYPDVVFQIWDFAGQSDFYTTHKLFLSPCSLYLLVYDLRLHLAGVDALEPWLLDIQVKNQLPCYWHGYHGYMYRDTGEALLCLVNASSAWFYNRSIVFEPRWLLSYMCSCQVSLCAVGLFITLR